MSWQILVLVHAGLAACVTLQKRQLMVKRGAGSAPLAMNAVMLSGLYLCGLVLAGLLGDINVGLAWQFSLPLLLGGVLFTASGICSLASFAYLESSVASIVSACNALFAIALAWLFLGERLSLTQAAGLAVLMTAVLYILHLGNVVPRNKKKRLARHKGIMLGLAGSLLFGFGLVIEKYAVTNMPTATYLVFGWGIQLLLAVAVLMFRPQQLRALRNKRIVRSAMAVGVTGGVAGACFILAQVASDNLSLISTLSNLRIVLVALLAGWLLHERDFFKRRVAAAAVAVVGVSLTLW